MISLQWHQIYLSNWGGQSEDGTRSVATLKQLRGVMFNEHRNRSAENISLVRMNTKFIVAPGSAPTDSVMNEQFVRGLEATLGTKAQKSAPMPPSVARALEQEFEHLFITAQGAYAKYAAAMAQLANLQLYTNFLRGNEPWKQKWKNFRGSTVSRCRLSAMRLSAPQPHHRRADEDKRSALRPRHRLARNGRGASHAAHCTARTRAARQNWPAASGSG